MLTVIFSLRNFLIFLILIFHLSSSAQTYSYLYKSTFNTYIESDSVHLSNEHTDSSGNNFLNQLATRIGLNIIIYYDIISDGKYMIIRSWLDTLVNNVITLHGEGVVELIIDVKGTRVFYPKTNKTLKLKRHVLDNNIFSSYGNCEERAVSKKGNTYLVTVCKNLPRTIMPPAIFTNIEYGIKKINTPKITIELLSYAKIKKDQRLKNCRRKFKTHPVSGEERDILD